MKCSLQLIQAKYAVAFQYIHHTKEGPVEDMMERQKQFKKAQLWMFMK